MRLIDADQTASIENLDQYSDLAAALGDVQTIRDILSDAPTIDAVPVVRCRECKYHRPIDYCAKHKQTGWFDDDFCSHGKRKEATHD